MLFSKSGKGHAESSSFAWHHVDNMLFLQKRRVFPNSDGVLSSLSVTSLRNHTLTQARPCPTADYQVPLTSPGKPPIPFVFLRLRRFRLHGGWEFEKKGGVGPVGEKNLPLQNISLACRLSLIESKQGSKDSGKTLTFPDGSEGKASARNVGDPGSIPGSEKFPEKEMATHSSTLAWRIPWTEELDSLQSMGSQRVGHD